MQFIVKPSRNGKIDSAHLTPGQRDGLRQHEITGQKFDAMDDRRKQMWLQEMEEDRYSAMRNYHKKNNDGLRQVLTKKVTQ